MAQIRADEITRVLREEIENYERAVNVAETGFVISVGDGIARVYGLETVMAGELVEFPHNVAGIALNLEKIRSASCCSATIPRSRKATKSAAPDALCRCRWVKLWSAAS